MPVISTRYMLIINIKLKIYYTINKKISRFYYKTYKVSSIHDAIFHRLTAVNVELQLQLLAFATFAFQALPLLSRDLRLLAASFGLGPLGWSLSLRIKLSR